MDEEWDTLIILDACRFDAFVEIEPEICARGDLRRVISLGSSTPEWLAKNFGSETHHDTVYVSSTPHITKLQPGTFHSVDAVFDWGFNRELGTIPPGPIVDAALDAREQYPDKRLIVHFAQPHMPPLNSKLTGDDDLGYVFKVRYGIDDLRFSDYEAAYIDNLSEVVAAVNDLLEKLSERIVITADHGELMGERLWPIPVRGLAHPHYIRHPALTRVPWYFIDGEPRDYQADPPQLQAEADESVVDDRLKALGYR